MDLCKTTKNFLSEFLRNSSNAHALTNFFDAKCTQHMGGWENTFIILGVLDDRSVYQYVSVRFQKNMLSNIIAHPLAGI